MEVDVRTSMVFLMGLLLGSLVAPGLAQGPRLTGENYVNHVGIAFDDFDGALEFYTQKMGFREAFVLRNAEGQPTLAYVQANRNTFVEIQRTNATRPQGISHYGLFVEDLNTTVATLKQRGVTVTDPRQGEDSLSANATDPAGVRIEMFQFGPDSAQGKAISSWK